MKAAGPSGNVIAMVINEEQAELLKALKLCNQIIISDATKPTEMLEKVLEVNGGREMDLSICCVNVPNCEMSCILPVKNGGTVYFFSMATSFTKSALGAEGIGNDINIIVGNGYTKNHADIALQILRESSELRDYFSRVYR